MTHRPNVLVTSASRKVLLVRAFRDALARVGGGRVIAADVTPMSAALFEADEGRLVPRSDDPLFVTAVERLCRDLDIGLIVPTRDEELPVFAAASEQLADAGIVVLVSSPDAVAMCQDKRRFADAVAGAGLEAPRTHAVPGDAPLPAFVKPRVGKGGRGAVAVRTAGELAAALDALDGDAIVQELIEAPELTVDVFLDLDGRPISCVPRERLAVVAGESVVSRTVRDDAVTEATLHLAAVVGLVGHVTVQLFRTADRILFIEVNPRYGGAANLSFAAGAPTPEFAVRLARGERVEPRLGDYEVGLVMLRYGDDRFVRQRDLQLLGEPA